MSMLKALVIDNTTSSQPSLNPLGALISRVFPEKINLVEHRTAPSPYITADILTALTTLKRLTLGQQSISLLLLLPLFSIFTVAYSP